MVGRQTASAIGGRAAGYRLAYPNSQAHEYPQPDGAYTVSNPQRYPDYHAHTYPTPNPHRHTSTSLGAGFCAAYIGLYRRAATYLPR